MTSPLRDKVVLLTGANAGLGYQLSLSLARMGAHVVMACRSPQRAELAREQLLSEVPAATATIVPLDVADPESIRSLGPLVGERVGQLDVVIHNAGVYGVPLSRNAAGHELHYATNYLGPFALTGVLSPYFRDASGSRIVFVGSLAHRLGKLLDEEPPNDKEADYRPLAAYGRSKLAMLTYMLELNRRLRHRGSKILALSAHPGFAPTETAKRHGDATAKNAASRWMHRQVERWMPTVAEAAAPILHAVTASDVDGGEYYGPGGWLEIKGAPTKAHINARARDEALAARLWSAAETLTGVRYLSDAPRS
jgi:NAD(P)-dependent dehydrogenase (short-subunit alcohol dehydrogenase family)